MIPYLGGGGGARKTQPYQAAHVYLSSPYMGVPGPSPLSVYLTSDKPDQTRTMQL